MLFYTYVWKDATGTPFYVGKGGRDGGKRSRAVAMRSQEFKSVYSAGGCTAAIVDEFILESQAHAHEMELIEKYGRREFGGLLVNKTEGGEGITGLVHTDAARAKIGAANRGRLCSLETRAKIGSAHRGRRLPDTSKAKTSASVQKIPPLSGRLKGASFERRRNKWSARITIRGKVKHLGYFSTSEAAAIAYDSAAHQAFGDDCYLNFRDRVAEYGFPRLAARSEDRG